MEAIANAETYYNRNRKAVTLLESRQRVQMHDLDHGYQRNESPYFYLQPNDYIYIKPTKKNGELKTGIESIWEHYYIVVIATTTFFCYLKIKTEIKKC
jgi:polysaccharide export outer membrane protein